MVNVSESASIPTKARVTNPLERRTAFRRDIQGLRAIAVLAVMLFHACKNWLPSGFVGVDVFFVISGFIICSLIMNQNKPFNWFEFYLGRVRRIVPAYGAMLAVVSVASALLFLTEDFSFFKKSLESAALFLSNQYFSGFGSYFAPDAHELPLLHTWSLAIEMQFYLFFPALILFTPRKYRAYILGALCFTLFSYSEWQLSVQDNQRYVYYSLVARIPEFLLGALIAVTGFGRDWSSKVSCLSGWAGLALLILCFVYLDDQHFPGALSALPCIAAALLIACRSGPVSRVLSAKGFVWVGALSYSLYLWHWPVLAFMRYYIGQYDLTTPWLVAFLLATFSLAWISFRYIECATRDKGGVLAKPLSLMALLTAAGLIAVASVELNKKIEKPLPVEMTRYAPAEVICHGRIIGDCLRGDNREPASVLVLGDSHAAQLNEFFDVVGQQDRLSVRVITASNCVPIPGFDVERIPDYSRADCRSQISELIPYINSARVIVVAAMWEWQAPNPAFMQGFSRFLDEADKRQVKVIVLAQIPMFEFNPLRVRRFSSLGLPVNVRKNASWEKSNNDVAELVSRYKNAKFLDFSHSEFFSSAPFYSGNLIYMDNHHLNELGAREYGAFASPLLKNILTSNY